jgi:hypothetical protein
MTCIYIYQEGLIEVLSRNGRVRLVTVNLARLLHGHHGGLLKNDGDIAVAFSILRQRMNDVTCGFSPIYWRWKMMELGWNFAMEFHRLERIIATSKHDWVRKNPVTQRGTIFAFRGTDFSFKAYNKIALLEKYGEVLPGHIPISRIEVVLKRKKLSEVTHPNDYFCSIRFRTACQWLRSCTTKMDDVVLLDNTPGKGPKSRLALILALAEEEGWRPTGVRAFDLATENIHQRTTERLRKEVHSIVLHRSRWSWKSLFPSDGSWPPPIETIGT